MNEAELLFTNLLDCHRHELYFNRATALDKDKQQEISRALKRRMAGEPLQYILAEADFFGFKFHLNQDVFIPRPETELLVEKALEIGRRFLSQGRNLRILDMGTGSGCIAISLAKFLPDAEIDAIDVSAGAIEIAEKNAESNKVKINFYQSDLFNSKDILTGTYQLIVSNPPYIPRAQIDRLSREVRSEPRLALDGGIDGLDFYRRLIKQSPLYLEPEGIIIMEIGSQQKQDIEKILEESNNLEITGTLQDYCDLDRIIIAKRAEKNG